MMLITELVNDICMFVVLLFSAKLPSVL